MTQKLKKISLTYFFPDSTSFPIFSAFSTHQLHGGKANGGCGQFIICCLCPFLLGGGFFTLFPGSSVRPHPHETVLHGLLQWESFPEAALHTQPSMNPFHGVQYFRGVRLGAGWQWFPCIWGKLLEACHRSHPCIAPTTKILPHKPNTCRVVLMVRLRIYLLEMMNWPRDKPYFCLITIKVSSLVSKTSRLSLKRGNTGSDNLKDINKEAR